jgi:hypothetical protein
MAQIGHSRDLCETQRLNVGSWDTEAAVLIGYIFFIHLKHASCDALCFGDDPLCADMDAPALPPDSERRQAQNALAIVVSERPHRHCDLQVDEPRLRNALTRSGGQPRPKRSG